ncbi:MAG: fibronectin-binding domain-containing protein [Anaerolineae bacterium]|nr:fibronectin-binding domain-containing protein [Anaerolineae bacterium]
MYFDVFTINALVDELTDRIAGGRVQKVIDLSESAVGLEVYAHHERHYLILDATPARPYALVSGEKLRRGLPHPTQLGLLLRRYVEGGIIEAISQPAWERMFTLHVDSPEGVSEVIFEGIERRANILLVQEGVILDCIRRVGAAENRVRVSLPGRDYVPPPRQTGRIQPDMVTLGDLEDCLEADPGEPAWRALTGRLLGISPLLAREIIFRAAGEPNARAGDTSARAVALALQDVLAPLLQRDWHPGCLIDQAGRVVACAPRPLTYRDSWQPAASMSEALVAYYGAPVGEEAYEEAKRPVREQLEEAIARVSHKAEAMRRSLRDQSELDALRQAGELLLAYQYTIPPGATTFAAQYDPDGPPITIALDPALSALENARQYFARYDKAKRALADVPERLAAAEQELAFLRQLETDLVLAASWPEIDEVRDALERDGYWRGPRQAHPQGGKPAPLRVETPEGLTIWVGRNARQNEQVTFGKGGPEDLWLHARGVPGAHVIIRSEGRTVPDAVIRRAAELAAYYSAARAEGRVLVDVTLRKYVRKIKGGKPGMVTYRHETAREVTPRGLENET